MTDDTAFLRAIIARPEDDSLRLIYADYLDETNRPERAEFIRVQIELAAMPDEVAALSSHDHILPSHPEQFRWKGKPGSAVQWERLLCCHALRCRERTLLAAHRLSWIEPLNPGWKLCSLDEFAHRDHRIRWTRGIESSWPMSVRFVRGFVAEWSVSGIDLVHIEAIRSATPLRKVTLTTWPIHQLQQHRGRTIAGPISLPELRDRYPGIKFVLPPANSPERFWFSSVSDPNDWSIPRPLDVSS